MRGVGWRVGSALAVLAVSACAGPSDPAASVAADQTLVVSQPDDGDLTCDDISYGIEMMNRRITLAQRMTTMEVGNRVRLDTPQDAFGGAGRVSNLSAGGGAANYPGIGDAPSVAMTGAGVEDDAALARQAQIAKAASARANELLRLGREKRCFA